MNTTLWRRWTLYCAAGELVGIGAAGAIAWLINSHIGEPHSLPEKLLVLFAMMAAGAIEGTVLGLMQWQVLRQQVPTMPRSTWVGWTTAVAVLGWFLGMLPSLFMFDEAPSNGTAPPVEISGWLFLLLSATTGLTLGAVFGLFQWVPLKEHVTNASDWILANALGWGVGICWIYLGASLPDAGASLAYNIGAGVAGGLLGGLSVGAITGWWLVRLEVRRSN